MVTGGKWRCPDYRRSLFDAIKGFTRLQSPFAIIAGLAVLMILGACTNTPETVPSPSPTPVNIAPTAAPAPPVASVETSVGGVVIEITDASTARYLVREQLANRNLPNDAIGGTSDVSGFIVFNSSGEVQPQNSKIMVNLQALRSDEAKRDNFIKENALESNKFPSAEINITSVTGLPWPLPESGEVSFQIGGDMTVHGVTQPVTWETLAQFGPSELRGKSKAIITFDQFGISKPSLFFILSLDDEIRLELDLVASITSDS